MPLYHVWFATKRRKWLLQGEVAEAALRLIRDVAQEKGIDLRASETMVDHVHLLIQAANQAGLSRAMNLLKGGSSYRLFREIPDLKMDAGVSSFWQHRYGAKEVPAGAATSVRTVHRNAMGQDGEVCALTPENLPRHSRRGCAPFSMPQPSGWGGN